MSPPLVSVLLCVRDGEKYLAEALDSVARQGAEGLEVIVVDDGSTDRSAEIAARHPVRARVVSQEPSGHGAALNSAVALATGTYLACLDCDDVWPAGRLDALLAACAGDPAGAWAYGQIINADAMLRPLAPPQAARMITASLVRRDAAHRIGAFRTDITHGASVDWASRALRIGLKFCRVETPVLIRRIHGDNMGVRGRPKAMKDLFQILREHRRRTRT